jgi:uncharacterized RDD family membrane protein YckC
MTEVMYQKAPFSKRILAATLDFIILFVVASLLAWGGNAILGNLGFFKDASNTYDDLQVASSLFVKNDGKITKIDKYYASEAVADQNRYYEPALDSFYSNTLFFESAEAGKKIYDAQKVGSSAIVDASGAAYFVVDAGGHPIKRVGLTDAEYNAFLVSALDNHAYSYLQNNNDYLASSKTMLWSYVVGAVIVLNISLVLVCLVVPLCFSRGKRTFGKAIMKLGVLDVHALSPSWQHYLLRFIFMLFVEVDLSLVSFGIPLFVSFSMLVFSKIGQPLHDYVCNTYVVDASSQSIYKTQEEYEEAKKHIDSINISKPGAIV